MIGFFLSGGKKSSFKYLKFLKITYLHRGTDICTIGVNNLLNLGIDPPATNHNQQGCHTQGVRSTLLREKKQPRSGQGKFWVRNTAEPGKMGCVWGVKLHEKKKLLFSGRGKKEA